MAREHWLDTLSKALVQGEGHSRKDFLKLLGATIVGLATNGASSSPAEAKNKPPKTKKKKKGCDVGSCPNGCCEDNECKPNSAQKCGFAGGDCSICGAGEQCVAGLCSCSPATCALPNVCCDGRC